MPAYAKGVFINVPFDRRYKRLFDALVFGVHDCGFAARCTKEEGDSSQIRLENLILDRVPYRYQVFCSDIAGQDIRAHHNQVSSAIIAVRDWLRTVRRDSAQMPGGRRIADRYFQFRVDLPRICKRGGLDRRNIQFLDYQTLVVGWLDDNEW